MELAQEVDQELAGRALVGHRSMIRAHDRGTMARMTADDDLERFVTAQDQADTYDGALRELRAGRKSGHWMWFIFPQLRGLGRSELSTLLRHRSPRRGACVPRPPGPWSAIAGLCDDRRGPGGHVGGAVLGEVDATKLRSSMTLFDSADPGEPVFRQVLDQWYDGRPDPLTLERLGAQERKEP